PVHGPGGHEAREAFRPRHRFEQPALDPEPHAILDDRIPEPHGLLGIVLEQQPDLICPSPGEARGKGAGHHDVAAEIALIEDAGIAGKAPLSVDGDARHRVPSVRPVPPPRRGGWSLASVPARFQANWRKTWLASPFLFGLSVLILVLPKA